MSSGACASRFRRRWSVGVVLYAMLSGRLPFSGKQKELLKKMKKEPLQQPHTLTGFLAFNVLNLRSNIRWQGKSGSRDRKTSRICFRAC